MKAGELLRILNEVDPDSEVLWEWKGGLLAPDLYCVERCDETPDGTVLRTSTAVAKSHCHQEPEVGSKAPDI